MEYGYHLVLDILVKDEKPLRDISFIEDLLLSTVREIGMQPIDGPHTIDYQTCSPIESGITSVIILAESHIATHAYPERKYVAIDIFSCKAYNDSKIIEHLSKYLNIAKYRKRFINRGLGAL